MWNEDIAMLWEDKEHKKETLTYLQNRYDALKTNLKRYPQTPIDFQKRELQGRRSRKRRA